jgi:hypothetical protein
MLFAFAVPRTAPPSHSGGEWNCSSTQSASTQSPDSSSDGLSFNTYVGVD